MFTPAARAPPLVAEGVAVADREQDCCGRINKARNRQGRSHQLVPIGMAPRTSRRAVLLTVALAAASAHEVSVRPPSILRVAAPGRPKPRGYAQSGVGVRVQSRRALADEQVPLRLRALRGGQSRWSVAAVAAARASYALLLFSSAAGSFSGALKGGIKQMDLVGCVVMGVVSGVGGGTIRDMMLGAPVFWTYLKEHMYMCVLCSLATFFLWPQAMRLGIRDTHLLILWADAISLASSAVIGAHIGHIRTGDAVLTIAVGIVTALFGGILCDLMCMEKPRVLYAERSMYSSPALLGMLLYVVLIRTALPQSVVIIASFLSSLSMRVLAWTYRLRAPHWTKASKRFRGPKLLAGKGPLVTMEVEITSKAPEGKR